MQEAREKIASIGIDTLLQMVSQYAAHLGLFLKLYHCKRKFCTLIHLEKTL